MPRPIKPYGWTYEEEKTLKLTRAQKRAMNQAKCAQEYRERFGKEPPPKTEGPRAKLRRTKNMEIGSDDSERARLIQSKALEKLEDSVQRMKAGSPGLTRVINQLSRLIKTVAPMADKQFDLDDDPDDLADALIVLPLEKKREAIEILHRQIQETEDAEALVKAQSRTGEPEPQDKLEEEAVE